MANNDPSDLVESALNKALTLMEGNEEGDILVEWVVVAFVHRLDNSKPHAYPMLFSNGEIPTHSAIGLLETGLNILHTGQAE